MCSQQITFLGAWTWRLIFIFMSLGGKKIIYAEGKIEYFAVTFPKHISKGTFVVCNRWPLTLAMTIPAAPRMSDELRVWCLPMTALSTRTRSDRRSCTTFWTSPKFSVREEEEKRRFSLLALRQWRHRQEKKPSPWRMWLQILIC